MHDLPDYWYHFSFISLDLLALAFVAVSGAIRGKWLLIGFLAIRLILDVGAFVIFAGELDQRYSRYEIYAAWPDTFLTSIDAALLVWFALGFRQGKSKPLSMGAVLLSFRGRISRATFWGTFLTLYFINITIGMTFMGWIQDDFRSEAMTTNIILGSLWLPVATWISLAIQVKRWHDRDKSGWRVLILFIPLVGPIWSIVELGFLPGTAGSNRFGDDPLSRVAAPAPVIPIPA